MDSEGIEKTEKQVVADRATVSVTIPDVPKSAHKRLKKWHLKLNAERGKQFSLMAAYREFIIEKTKTLEF
jgi:hypothetical protein